MKNALIIVSIVFLVSLTVLANILISNEARRAHFIGLDSQRFPTIQVTGEGSVYASPDTAEIYFSVVTGAETTEEALNENNKKMDRVINHLKEKNIEEKDIKTAGFNVRPIYSYDNEKRERILSSYEVSNVLEVRLKDLQHVSSVIDGAIRAGANRVNRLKFLISDEEELKKEAREKAIREAEKRAAEIASSLGVKVGRIVNFSEERDYYFPLYREAALDAASEEIPEVPIEPGENEIKVNVRIEYEIR